MKDMVKTKQKTKIKILIDFPKIFFSFILIENYLSASAKYTNFGLR
jgi:hypothetical protein